jgi:hypothetical protein
MTYTFDENTVSDLHKDARGSRPTEYFWEEWTQCGDDTRQAMWDNLCRELEDTMAVERDREARALAGFGQRIVDNINLGADSIETAIRWTLEAEQMTAHDLAYGADYVAFHFGLCYQNSYKDQITAAINQMQLEIV